MSDWSRDAANKLRKRVGVGRRDEENAASIESRKLLEEQGPALWQQVREHVTRMCAELNADYEEDIAVVQVGPARELNVQLRHPGNMSELKASFGISTSADALRWSYAGPAARMARGEQYSLHVNAGTVIFQNSLTPSTPESIARQMLDGLLQE